MALIQTLKRHALLTYFVLVYVLSWAFWIPMFVLPRYSPLWNTFSDVGNFMPSLVGILLTALFLGKSGLGELFRRLGQVRNPLIWYAVVLLFPFALQLVAVGVPTLLGLTSMTFAFPVLYILVASFLVAALGEELGWRGFALPRMQASLQALAASLLLGVLWGLWHLPKEIAIGISPLGYLDFVLSIIGFSVLFTWVYNNTRGSLFLMVLFHAVFDTASLTILPTSTTWIVPVLYLILLWVTVAIVVVITGATRLSRSRALAPA